MCSVSGDASQLPLIRLKATPRAQIKNVLRTGWTAEPIGNGQYFGFTLDGDGRFLLGDFTVTHNTSTLIALVKFLLTLPYVNRMIPRIFLGAFNKAISVELSEKMGVLPGVDISTMHALGLLLCKQLIQCRIEIDSHKVSGLAHKVAPWNKKYRSVITKVVGYAKQAGFGVKGCPGLRDKEAWTRTCDHYDVWDEVPAEITPERLFNDCYKVYNQSLAMAKDKGLIDFDDMLLLPLMWGLDSKPEIYDWVLIDEAQDNNQVRRMLAMLVLKTGGRLVAVGDDRQAIYGFAGASHDSMERIKECMGSQELPLSTTYRCPRLIVELANHWVPDIAAHESAPDGKITDLHYTDLWSQEFSSSDVVLCRNTRPLIGVAQRLRREGVPCIVEGNNGQGIIGLATKWGEITIGELRTNLSEYLKEQVDKWTEKQRMDKVENANDRVGQVLDIAGGMGNSEQVRKLVARIESLFGRGEGQDHDVLHLCTIHRSKGREWDRVFWLGPDFYHPSKWAKQDWEKKQEENLEYVCATRTKKELVRVEVARPLLDRQTDEMVEWWDVKYAEVEAEDEHRRGDYGVGEGVGEGGEA